MWNVIKKTVSIRSSLTWHVIKPSAIFLLLYRQYRRKQFIGFSPDQRFLTYTQTKVFYFDPDASGPGLDESDTICTINIPFIVCLHGMHISWP